MPRARRMEPPPRTTERTPAARGRLLLAAAFAALSLGWLGRQVAAVLHAPPRAERLRLGEDVPLIAPPPPAAEESRRFRARLHALWSHCARALSNAEAESALLVARRALRDGDPLAALAVLERARARHPSHLPLLERIGGCEVRLGLYRRAERTYRALLRADPASLAGRRQLARVLVALRRHEEAVRLLDEASQRVSPAEVPARLALAEEFEAMGDLNRALREVQRARSAQPSDPSVRFAFGRLLYQLQRPEEARRELEKLLRDRPNDARARYYLALAASSPLLAEPDSALAEDLLLRNVEADPSDRRSLQRLGELYQEQERFRQAAFAFARALQIDPGQPAARWQFARALTRLGHPAAAREETLALQRLRYEREEQRVRARLARDPEDPAAYLALARLQESFGDFTRAHRSLCAAWALAGTPPAALRAFDRRHGLSRPDFLAEALERPAAATASAVQDEPR